MTISAAYGHHEWKSEALAIRRVRTLEARQLGSRAAIEPGTCLLGRRFVGEGSGKCRSTNEIRMGADECEALVLIRTGKRLGKHRTQGVRLVARAEFTGWMAPFAAEEIRQRASVECSLGNPGRMFVDTTIASDERRPIELNHVVTCHLSPVT